MGTITRNTRVTRSSAGNRRTAEPTAGSPARGHIAGPLAVAAFAIAATALAAPAGGTATRVGAEPGLSFGSATSYGTGCGYMINAYVDDPSTPVVFYDNGIQFAVARPSGALAQARWTPATVGPHRITVVQHSAPGEDVVPWLDLTAATGLSSGSGCYVVGG
ncbi:hypothetical protein ACFVUS_14795 [Nocardia sp. NPDC058058]|uniref:hypothetical protein n=1 Tax=Nocardia sp. NPDC058058 TaxID=3346317 RepID=UPI0036D8C5BB